MRRLCGWIPWMLSILTVAAHPGVGIVQDGQGNVFFTDTKQVWRIAPDDSMAVVVPGVHTHELCLDSRGQLYGEHLWYEGDATGKWRHRVWVLRTHGGIGEVLPAREGFLQNYSFVRDQAGNMFWADRGKETLLKKLSVDGRITTLPVAGLRSVGWMTAAPHGTLYFIDAGDLRRVSPRGELSTLAARLTDLKSPTVKVTGKNYHLGLWLGRGEDVYVAIPSERLVLRVDAAGKSSAAARSPSPWAPSGGLLDRSARLWLLEFDPSNAVRVRRIVAEGRERVFVAAPARP